MKTITVSLTLSMMTLMSAQASTDDAAIPLELPASDGAMAPNLTTIDQGIALTWLEPVSSSEAEGSAKGGRSYKLLFSIFDGGKWSEPITIIKRNDLFANWADIPSIQQTDDGSLYTHWLQKSDEGTFAYDVMLAYSANNGSTWTELGSLHNDGTSTEHGFVSLLPEGKGLRAFWLDGRAMSASAEDNQGHGGGDMSIRTTFILKNKIGKDTILDGRVCECCGTSAALTAKGPVILYRDRSPIEVRDISVVRLFEDDIWTEQQRIHVDDWKFPACPVNGPAVAAKGNQVVATWFTGSNDIGKVLAAYSDDCGANFTKPIVIDNTSPLGRVDIEILDNNEAVVSWLSSDDLDNGLILLRRINAAGESGPAVKIAETSIHRASGFPKIALTSDGLLVVWTNVNIEERKLNLSAATIKIENIPVIE